MPHYKTFVILKIRSRSLSPQEIISLVGLSPDTYWKIGDTLLGGRIKHKDNGWSIECKSLSSNDYDIANKLIAKLLRRIRPYTQKIFSLSKNKNISQIILSCVQYIKNDANPQFFLKNAVLKKITNLGADIDMDLYNLGEDK